MPPGRSSPPTTASPHRSPALTRIHSRSAPAPPVLDQMENMTIKDRRSYSTSSNSSNEDLTQRAGAGQGFYGHQRLPADLVPGQGQGLPRPGVDNGMNKLGYRQPSSEPVWQARQRETSSSTVSTAREGSYESDDNDEQGGSTFKPRNGYEGGVPLGRAITRQPASDDLRDPYDFDRRYDDYPQSQAQAQHHHYQSTSSTTFRTASQSSYDEDEDQDQSTIMQPRERSTLAGTPLFSAGPEERYELLQKLGQGNFGTVWKALDKETNEVVAIKHVCLEDNADEISEIQSEIVYLSGCNSPYITRYLGSFVGRRYTLWIIMEYLAGGSGSDIIKPGPLNEPQAAIVLREILHGLAYLHSQGIIHRDIKSANIIFSDTGEVKLADFGVSGQLRSAKSIKNTFVGTPLFMAPEVILQGGYGHKADLWSLGITAIELVAGKPPYGSQHPMKLLFLIPSMEPPKLEGEFSDEFKDFVSKCLVKEPLDRWDTADLLEHPFIRKAGRVQSLQRLVNRLAEHKRTTNPHSRSETSLSAQTMNLTIDGDEDGWDFGNGTMMSAQGEQIGTIRPGKGSEARVFERDVQPYQAQHSMSDAYPEDDRRRTFIVNDDVPDDFEQGFEAAPSLKSSGSASQADSTEIRTPPMDTPKQRPVSVSSSNIEQQTIKPALKQAPLVAQQRPAPKTTAETGVGEILIRDVVLPVVAKTVSQAKSAVDLQALHSIQQGFQILSRENSELANQMMVDIMAGLRDNQDVRAQLTQRLGTVRPTTNVRQTFSVDPVQEAPSAPAPRERTPINDMLYMRWLDGLKLKWPLAGSS